MFKDKEWGIKHRNIRLVGVINLLNKKNIINYMFLLFLDIIIVANIANSKIILNSINNIAP